MIPANLNLSNGENIPPIGLGTYSGANVKEMVKFSIDIGYRLIDTAFIYRNEKEVGEAISEKLKEGKLKREDLFVVTKLWCNQFRDVSSAIKKSLFDLKLDYVDLYLMHWPFGLKPTSDPYDLLEFKEDGIPLEEVWPAMEECVKSGYAKSIGLSNFNSEQIERILGFASVKPVVNEIEVNPYINQKRLIEFCKNRDIRIIAYSPFFKNNKHGLVNGISIFEEPVLKQLADKYKKTTAQIILRFVVQLGAIPIPKSDRIERLEKNFDVFNFTLGAEDMQKLETLNKNVRCTPFTQVQHFKEYPFKIEY